MAQQNTGAVTRTRTMNDVLEYLNEQGHLPPWTVGDRYVDHYDESTGRIVGVRNPDEARAMGLNVAPDGSIAYSDYARMIQAGRDDDFMSPTQAAMLGMGLAALPVGASIMGGQTAGGGGLDLAEWGAGEAGMGSPGGIDWSAVDLGEWGSGEAGMSGSAGSPSYGNTSGVPIGNGSAGGNVGTAPGTPRTGGGTVIDRIINGNASPGDWANILGQVGSGVLGYMGSDAQGDAYRDVASQFWNAGAPFRDMLKDSFGPNFNPMQDVPGLNSAVNSSMDAAMRSLSTQGNPYGNPGGITEARQGILSNLVLPATANYRGALTQAGGFGLNTSGSAAIGGAGEEGGKWDAIGGALAGITTPRTDWEELLRKMQGGQSLKLNTGGPT